jgi:DNA-directed RNA polymerase specialized sigma24 family protein
MSSKASPMIALHQGLMTGIAREAARALDRQVADPVCRQAAWMIMNAGYGLSYQEIAAAAGVSKQAVGEAMTRMADRCDNRQFERRLMQIANTFGVGL